MQGSIVTPLEEQISNNELASIMRASIIVVKDEIKTINEKLTVNDGQIDRLIEAMSNVSQKVETISAENKTISVSVDKNKDDIDELIKQQNEFNAKYEQIIMLANSLKEKESMIKHMQLRIEALEAEHRVAKDRNEQWEQHSRIMNLWIYVLGEGENENTRQTLRDFCTNVLKLGRKCGRQLAYQEHSQSRDYKKEKRPVIVAFVLWEERQTLLRAAKDLFQYNKDNDTTYAIKTDLALRARQLRKDLHIVSNSIKQAEGCFSKVRDNHKGKVRLVRKQKKEDKNWVPVTHINPQYLPKGKSIYIYIYTSIYIYVYKIELTF